MKNVTFARAFRRVHVYAARLCSTQRSRYTDDPLLRGAWDLEDAATAEPRSGSLGRYSDDSRHQNAVSERSNCGMGMVFLRAPTWTLRAINELVPRLRNLEVNTTKRFVCLTAESHHGIDPMELLLGLAAQEHQSVASTGAQFYRTVLEHSSELAYLLAAYRKPLVALVNGPLVNEAMSLLRLCNFGACYRNTSCTIDALFRDQILSGGVSYMLARLDESVAQYLLFTGGTISGPNCVYAGLCTHYMHPDALPFLEVGAEKLAFEMPESEVPYCLFRDHSLPLPDPLSVTLGEASLSFAEWWMFIKTHFKPERDFTFSAIRESLKNETRDDSSRRAFALECLRRLDSLDSDEHRTARAFIGWSIQQAARDGRNRSKDSNWRGNVRDETELLARVLCTETEIGCLWNNDLVREARTDESAKTFLRAYSSWIRQPERIEGPDGERMPPLYYRLRRLEDRPDLPLSSHPRLRYYHDQYEPKSRRDHDVRVMEEEVRRWSTEYMSLEREKLLQVLSGSQEA